MASDRVCSHSGSDTDCAVSITALTRSSLFVLMSVISLNYMFPEDRNRLFLICICNLTPGEYSQGHILLSIVFVDESINGLIFPLSWIAVRIK